MASNKRRRLYEGFGLLEEKSEDNHEIISGKSYDNHVKKEDGNLESHDNPMTNLTIDMGKSYDNHVKNFNWFEFSKLQQNILLFIHKNCVFNASLATNPIRISEFETALKTSPGSIRKTIYNLIQMKALKRESFKDGPGGWSKFVLTKEVYDLIGLESDKNNNLKIILGLSHDNLRSNHEKTTLNSSINDLNKELDTTTIKIPENLKTIISQKELQNLLKTGQTEETLNFSLKNFSYDYENNLVKSKNPIGLFFGVLRSGNSYKSLTLLDIENKELQEYQNQLKKLEIENQHLKQSELIKKFEDYKTKNVNFLNEIKSKQKFEISDQVLNSLAFEEWLKQNEI